MTDLWADDKKPDVKEAWEVWNIRIPGERDTVIYLEVDHADTVDYPWQEEYRYVHGFGEYSRWFGKDVDKMTWEERKEIWEWLVEWELVALLPIGPDDKEYFATKELFNASGNHSQR